MIVIIILIVVMLIKMLDTLSGRIFAAVENYPELRTSDVFAELQQRYSEWIS